MEENGPVAAHLVTPYLFTTGAWIYDQIRSLERYRAIVVTSEVENLDAFPWSPVETVPGTRESRREYLHPATAVSFASRFVKLTRLLRRAAVAHAHFGPEGFDAIAPARAAGVPLIVSFYGYDLTQLPAKYPIWRTRYTKLFAAATAVLVEGSHMRDVLVELGCPPSKARVQRLGVDLSAIPFTERRRRGPVRVLVAASFREKKGIPYALEALAGARKAGLDARLTLIGAGPDAASIDALIEQLGLGESISRRPYLSHAELIAEYAHHDVLIQPSITAADGDTEGGLPVTILEAAAAGMPILTTSHCDIPDAIVDGRGGFVVAERDAAALTEAMLKLAQREVEWPAMGAFNRGHIGRRYDLVTQIQSLEEIYDRARS